MPKNLPDVVGPSTLGRGDLVRFARLESQIEKALKVAAEPIGAALRAIRDGRLYLATHTSFERYVVERWGFSKATAYRMMDGEKLAGISPPESASSQVSTSHGETNKGEPSTIGSPLPAKSPEGLDQQDYTGPASEPTKPGGADSANDLPTPSGPSSEGGEQDGETRPAPSVPTSSGKSSEGVGKNGAGSLSHSAPGDSIARPGSPAPSDRPPSDRQLTARVFAAMREVDPTDAGPVTTPEEATFLRQWAQRTLDAWKAKHAPPAPAEKPQRRQGTITVPAERLNGTVGRPSTRVTIPTIPVPTRAKRHADDCSCLSCVPPKAAAK